MPTARELLVEATSLLEKSSPSAALDARILLEHASGLPRLKLAADPDQQLSGKVTASFQSAVQRRSQHEPIAYITGRKEFYGAEFLVCPDVLIPRPETEILVEKVLQFLNTCPGDSAALDLGTGSGCIAVTLARELKAAGRNFHVSAIDASEKALQVAKRNAKQQGVASEITFITSDWFSALSNSSDRFDVIVSNPPYIAEGDTRISPELRFEPAEALYSSSFGLSDILHILQEGPRFLKPHGKIFFETGFEQHAAVRELLGQDYGVFESYKDLAGLDRVLVATPARR
ncbi:MAG: peptide chain release factor N(5)-glutamine methyltransferase [Deltaproteobacteria bacterium]|nr:peptide chain release factor N(5)-glutamine methyltransferase [Deltaproteobacteria bacterium]